MIPNSTLIKKQQQQQQSQSQYSSTLIHRTPPPPPVTTNRLPQRYKESPGTELANQLAGLSLNAIDTNEIKPNRILSFERTGSTSKGQEKDDNNSNELGSSQESILGEELMDSERDSNQDNELAFLAVSSQITELSLAIEETNTVIFEIQELRHTTASSTFTSPQSTQAISLPSLKSTDLSTDLAVTSTQMSREPSSHSNHGGLSEVDIALIKLDDKLEIVAKEFAVVESQITPIFTSISQYSEEARNHAEFLREKWFETVSNWESTKNDADILSDELKEDKWLVVFRVVSSQAEEMMSSLDKILNQSHEFIRDINRRQNQLQFRVHTSGLGLNDLSPSISSSLPTSPFQFPIELPSSSPSSTYSPHSSPFHLPLDLPNSTTTFPDSQHSIQSLLSTFQDLNTSLTAKVKYYSPAVERVLKILEKGISERSTKNGEVLRKFGEMNLRWKEGGGRIDRVKEEMKVLEVVLRETLSREQVIVSTSSTFSTPTTHSSSSIPKPSTASPSPFRRLATKITSSTRHSPPVSTPIASTSTSSSSSSIHTRPSPSPSTSNLNSFLTTPSRPIKSTKRIESSPDTFPTQLPLPPPLSSSSSRPTINRISQSFSTSNLLTPPSLNSRSRSPVPSDGGYSNYGNNNGPIKPRWNISSKRPEEKEILLDRDHRVLGGGGGGDRNSYFQPIRDSPSSSNHSVEAGNNGRHSSLGISTRNRLSQSFSGDRSERAPSPAFSTVSNDSINTTRTTNSNYRRPQTPTSIPRPQLRPRGSSISSNSNQYLNSNNLLGKSLPAILNPNMQSTAPHTHRSRISSGSFIPQPSPQLQRSTSPTSHSTTTSHSTPPSTSTNLRTPYTRPMSNNNNKEDSRPPLTSTTRRSSYTSNTSQHQSLNQSSQNQNRSRPTSSVGFNSSYHLSSRSPSTGISGVSGGGRETAYRPNPIDPLDIEIANIINSLPTTTTNQFNLQRLDPPLTPKEFNSSAIGGYSARYSLGFNSNLNIMRNEGGRAGINALTCKLVQREGKKNKVMVRVGGGFTELESYALGLLGNSL